jgi:hypothetical protein
MEDVKEVKTRRGMIVHEKNPFIGQVVANTKTGVRKLANKSGDQMMVVSASTGEIVAPAGFWQYQEVDKTQFLKLYEGGVKAFKDLSNAGSKVFSIMSAEIQSNMGKGMIYLSFNRIDQAIYQMSVATYTRGMRELIDKEFLATSADQGWYFINPDYIFNGDRMAFVREYRLKGSTPKRDPKTIDLLSGKTDEEAQNGAS